MITASIIDKKYLPSVNLFPIYKILQHIYKTFAGLGKNLFLVVTRNYNHQFHSI